MLLIAYIYAHIDKLSRDNWSQDNQPRSRSRLFIRENDVDYKTDNVIDIDNTNREKKRGNKYKKERRRRVNV